MGTKQIKRDIRRYSKSAIAAASVVALTAAKAKDAPSKVSLDFCGAVSVLEAAAGGDAADPKSKLKRFEMLAYTGGPMVPKTTPPLRYPIVVDLASLDLSKQHRPALKDHDSKALVGHTEMIASDGKQLTASGVISGTGDAAREVVETAGNGFQWQVSIGLDFSASATQFIPEKQTVQVNGRSIDGPVYVARRGRVREISFLSMGAADDDATARIAATAAKDNPMFEQWLEARGFDAATLDDKQRASLEAMFKLEGKKTGDDNSADLDSVLDKERKKDERRQSIVNLTAKALQDNPGQLTIIEAMSRQAMEGDWDTQRYELELLRATRPQKQAYNRMSRDDGLTDQVIEAALCLTGGIDKPEESFSEQVLDMAAKRWPHGLGLGEVLMLSARRNGYETYSTRSVGPLLKAAFAEQVQISASGISTISLPGIFANTANKFLKAGYFSVEDTWRAISAKRAVKDFKQITSYSLTGDFVYLEIPPGGDLKHAGVGEISYTNQAKTYGRMFGIDRRDIINDDLGALTDVPKKLGRGGALKFNLVFWTAFLNNSTFFATGENNYITGVTVGTNDSRLNIEGLGRAETVFLNQTDEDGNPLATMPRILLTPNALSTVAAQLMRDTEVRDTTANTRITTGNPHAGKFTPVRSSYLSNSAITGYSVDAWYLLSAPEDIPVIEAVFLNGVETPTVEQADADFSQLGIQMRGYHDFGVTLQEPKGGVKAKGAA